MRIGRIRETLRSHRCPIWYNRYSFSLAYLKWVPNAEDETNPISGLVDPKFDSPLCSASRRSDRAGERLRNSATRSGGSIVRTSQPLFERYPSEVPPLAVPATMLVSGFQLSFDFGVAVAVAFGDGFARQGGSSPSLQPDISCANDTSSCRG